MFKDRSKRKFLKVASGMSLLPVTGHFPPVHANPVLAIAGIGGLLIGSLRLIHIGGYISRASRTFAQGIRPRSASSIAKPLVLSAPQAKLAAGAIGEMLGDPLTRAELEETFAERLRAEQDSVFSADDRRRLGRNAVSALTRLNRVPTLLEFADHTNAHAQTSPSLREHLRGCVSCASVSDELLLGTDLGQAPLLADRHAWGPGPRPREGPAARARESVVSTSIYAW